MPDDTLIHVVVFATVDAQSLERLCALVHTLPNAGLDAQHIAVVTDPRRRAELLAWLAADGRHPEGAPDA